MSYFLIYGSEDGTQIVQFERADKLKQILEDHGHTQFRKELGDADTNYWDGSEALLIEGRVVVPQPRKVVEDWDIPKAS
jgi:hypothetical protein